MAKDVDILPSYSLKTWKSLPKQNYDSKLEHKGFLTEYYI